MPWIPVGEPMVGPPGTIDIGEVKPLAASATPYVAISGPPAARKAEFGIPIVPGGLTVAEQKLFDEALDTLADFDANVESRMGALAQDAVRDYGLVHSVNGLTGNVTIPTGGAGATSWVDLTTTGQAVALGDPLLGRVITVVLTQKPSGTPLFPGSVLWDGGVAPSWSTAPGARDVVTMLGDGTNWVAFLSSRIPRGGNKDTTPPTAPPNLTLTATATTIKAVWDAATDNYAVERYIVSNGTTTHEIVAGTGYAREWTFYGLTPATSYTVTVAARDVASNEGPNISRTISTSAGAADTPPTAPTGLTATASPTSISLSWTAATDDKGVVAYRVRANGVVKSSTITGTSYTITGLAPEATVTVLVDACDIAGRWGPTATVTASTFEPLPEDSFRRYAFNEGSGYTSAEANGLADPIAVPSASVGGVLWPVGHEGGFGWRTGAGWPVGRSRLVAGATTGQAPIATTAWSGFSIAFWFDASVITAGLGVQLQFSENFGGTGNATRVSATATGPKVLTSMSLEMPLGGSTRTVTANISPGRGDWLHFAATWDRTSGVMRAYIDGVESGTFTAPSGAAWMPLGELDFVNKGTVDDLRFWNRPLTAAQVRSWMLQKVAP